MSVVFNTIDTKASEKVSAIIQNKAFCRDVMKLSPQYQTSTCEAFHSVIIHFAPKSTAFTYKGMLARYSKVALLIDKYNRLPLFQPTSLQMTYKDILYSQVHCSHFISLTHTLCYTIRLYLAMLHYNENCGRQQAQTKKGEKIYAVLYPKYKKGGHVVRKLVEHCTYGMPQ